MKATHIKAGTYKAPNPGLFCPACRSNNTVWSCKEQAHLCFDCLELFRTDRAYSPAPQEIKPYAYSERGDEWYRTDDGRVFIITVEERAQINEEMRKRKERILSSEYQAWLAGWHRLGKELEQRAWLESLTPEQIQQLKERLS